MPAPASAAPGPSPTPAPGGHAHPHAVFGLPADRDVDSPADQVLT